VYLEKNLSRGFVKMLFCLTIIPVFLLAEQKAREAKEIIPRKMHS
jgi:hypothetical protein